MGNTQFEKVAIKAVQKYYRDEHNKLVPIDDLYVVWLVKVLQNNKCLISSVYEGDTSYFEMTYSGEKNVMYMDVYEKRMNQAIVL